MNIKRIIAGRYWTQFLRIFPFKHISLSEISMGYINGVYNIEKKSKHKLIKEILEFDASDADFVTEEERACPGDQKFIKSGYYNTMLKRYLFAGKYCCNGKKVLDSCSGLGWGSYILSHYTCDLTSFDLSSDAVNYSKAKWGKEVNWLTGDALNLDFLGGEKFEVAVAMESIEHFSKVNGELYIKGLSEVLLPGGILIGSSAFPNDRERADELCSTNPYHLYIFTKSEMENILSKYFSSFTIIERWMFIAKK